jgi:hypothetical protein
MIRYRLVQRTCLRVTCGGDGQNFWLTKAEVVRYPEFVKKRITLRARLRWLRRFINRWLPPGEPSDDHLYL